MQLQPLMGRLLLCVVIIVMFCSEASAGRWWRLRRCAPRPVTYRVIYPPVCGLAPAYPFDGRSMGTVPPPAPARTQRGIPGGRQTEMLRPEAETDPPPPPPDSTRAPAQAPQPTLSPRDIQPTVPEAPATPGDADAGDDLGRILGTEP